MAEPKKARPVGDGAGFFTALHFDLNGRGLRLGGRGLLVQDLLAVELFHPLVLGVALDFPVARETLLVAGVRGDALLVEVGRGRSWRCPSRRGRSGRPCRRPLAVTRAYD